MSVWSDMLVVIGFGAVVFGVWMIYPPAAIVFCGLVLILGGAGLSLRGRTNNGGS